MKQRHPVDRTVGSKRGITFNTNQRSGILKQQDIDRSMFEFMQGNRSESDLKLDMANLVYEGFAEHVFNLPPDL